MHSRPWGVSRRMALAVWLCTSGRLSLPHVLLQVGWGGVPASAWAALAWAGLGTSFAAHSAVSWAVGRCSAVVPSIYSCMQVRIVKIPSQTVSVCILSQSAAAQPSCPPSTAACRCGIVSHLTS